MSTEDIQRESQTDAEREEAWPWRVWTEQALAQLWEEAGSTVPAPFDGVTEDNQEISEQGLPGTARAPRHRG
jgi:hypothetical protein